MPRDSFTHRPNKKLDGLNVKLRILTTRKKALEADKDTDRQRELKEIDQEIESVERSLRKIQSFSGYPV